MSQSAHATSTEPGSPAVAAIPPVTTGTAPAPAGASSLTVAPADAAGGRDKTFSFPVTIYATATIGGTIEDEARNTIGCDLRDAIADDGAVDLDNGGTITFERFDLAAPVLTALEMLTLLHQYRNDMICFPSEPSRRRRIEMVEAAIARIDGKA